jgi:organic radical activating enzyme
MLEEPNKNMKKGMKDNIERKQPSINDVNMHEGIPLFSFIELNINEICNRKCPFCPRVNPKIYPNQNIHMDLKTVESIADQLNQLNFKGIVNISGTGEPLLTTYITDIVKLFGDRNIHIEIVTNGDVLTRKVGRTVIYGSELINNRAAAAGGHVKLAASTMIAHDQNSQLTWPASKPIFPEAILLGSTKVDKTINKQFSNQKKIFEYLKQYNIPKHPLEQRGYTSIGCEPCTRKVDLEMQAREARWFGLNKVECGLHTDLIVKE